MESIKVADEVWIGTALLHREQPARESFSTAEIVDRVGIVPKRGERSALALSRARSIRARRRRSR